ncbi:MAG: hypothetical protein H0U70_06900 [Tatlockia sp.]|nr:hypothetical protein [Tatlockia sp.]
MKKIVFLLVMLLINSFAIAAKTVIWTAVFDNMVPRSEKISMKFCLDHTPTVLITSVDQVLSKNGVKTVNGLRVKYNSYTSTKKDGLLFNVVHATVSGKDEHGEWSAPMKMYQQTLSESDQGKTWVVWSTPQCKGTFIGVPTINETKKFLSNSGDFTS